MQWNGVLRKKTELERLLKTKTLTYVAFQRNIFKKTILRDLEDTSVLTEKATKEGVGF